MKKYLDVLLKAFLAGIMIGIGGSVFLACDNKYLGAFLFGLGLFSILFFGFNLYTGKIGYAVENKPSYIIDLVLIWIGNLLGTFFVGFSLQFSRVGQVFSEKAAGMCETKLNDDLLSIFILAFFCGMLMFVAADGFKTIKNSTGQVFVIILPVAVFILCGFEHCVANMFYFSVSNKWDLNTFIYMLVMTLGNSVGGMTIPFIRKFFVKEKV